MLLFKYSFMTGFNDAPVSDVFGKMNVFQTVRYWIGSRCTMRFLKYYRNIGSRELQFAFIIRIRNLKIATTTIYLIFQKSLLFYCNAKDILYFLCSYVSYSRHSSFETFLIIAFFFKKIFIPTPGLSLLCPTF